VHVHIKSPITGDMFPFPKTLKYSSLAPPFIIGRQKTDDYIFGYIVNISWGWE